MLLFMKRLIWLICVIASFGFVWLLFPWPKSSKISLSDVKKYSLIWYELSFYPDELPKEKKKEFRKIRKQEINKLKKLFKSQDALAGIMLTKDFVNNAQRYWHEDEFKLCTNLKELNQYIKRQEKNQNPINVKLILPSNKAMVQFPSKESFLQRAVIKKISYNTLISLLHEVTKDFSDSKKAKNKLKKVKFSCLNCSSSNKSSSVINGSRLSFVRTMDNEYYVQSSNNCTGCEYNTDYSPDPVPKFIVKELDQELNNQINSSSEEKIKKKVEQVKEKLKELAEERQANVN